MTRHTSVGIHVYMYMLRSWEESDTYIHVYRCMCGGCGGMEAISPLLSVDLLAHVTRPKLTGGQKKRRFVHQSCGQTFFFFFKKLVSLIITR